MSQNATKNYNGLTYLGWFACILIIIAAAFYLFIARVIISIVPFDVYLLIYNIVSYMRGGAEVLLLLSFLNYCLALPSSKKTLLLVVLLGTALFRILEMTVGIDWGSAGFLKPPVKNLALLLGFLLFWEKGMFPKILTGIKGIRILLLLINGFAGSVTLSRLRLFIIIAEMVVLMIWFGLGIPQKMELSPGTQPQYASPPLGQTFKATPATSHGTDSQHTHRPAGGKGIPPQTEWTHGIPRLLYWCNQCQKQIKFRPKNNDDIEKEHPCPTCSTPILGWWVEPTKDSYIRFMIGLIIMFSGFSTILFVTTIGNYGLSPLTILMSLSIAEMAAGGFVAYKTTNVKITRPAPYATTTPSIEGNKDFIKELIIFVVIAFGGAMVGYFLNTTIVGIFF